MLRATGKPIRPRLKPSRRQTQSSSVNLKLNPQEYALRKFLMRADVLHLQNGHSNSDRYHVKIFNLVRLTTEAEL